MPDQKPSFDEIETVRCPECGHEQSDMGRNVRCEECGQAPMPYRNPATGQIEGGE